MMRENSSMKSKREWMKHSLFWENLLIAQMMLKRFKINEFNVFVFASPTSI